MKKKLFTTQQVAELLHYADRSTVTRLAKKYNLGFSIGSILVFEEKDIKAFEQIPILKPRRKKNFLKNNCLTGSKNE